METEGTNPIPLRPYTPGSKAPDLRLLVRELAAAGIVTASPKVAQLLKRDTLSDAEQYDLYLILSDAERRIINDIEEKARTPTHVQPVRGPGTWTSYFSRSAYGQNVFYRRGSSIRPGGDPPGADFFGAAIAPFRGIRFPHRHRFGVFSSSCWYVSFLDGGFVSVAQPYFPTGLDGEYVIGFEALRFMCHRLNIGGPRALKGEQVVRTPEEIEERLHQQLRESRTELETRLDWLERVLWHAGEDSTSDGE